MSTNVKAERHRERHEEKRPARASGPLVATPPPLSPGYMVWELIPIKDEGNVLGGRFIDGRPEVYVSRALVEMASVDMSTPCPLDDLSEVEDYDPRV
jgi:hypothetical protein